MEAAADWDQLHTAETYLGQRRSSGFASQNGATFGKWMITPENVVLGEAGGSIAFRFHARDAHVVLSPGAHEPIAFRVRLDGEVPGPSHGVDVDEDGHGLLRDACMYQLVRRHDAVRDATLEIAFLAPGAEGCSFTFG